jgi:(E)-4-hydroxy-3-methylbut-2-enyl-diphosphate synthase
MRKYTKKVWVGGVQIGGGAPISIQSMTNTKTVKETIEQIHLLENEGVDIVRIAVPDLDTATKIKEIKANIKTPLVADIHFNHKLAIESIKQGVDKIRINPGNIGSKEKIKEIVKCAKDYNIPIRIGVNSGSLEKDLFAKFTKPTKEALVESALRSIKILEDLDFYNTVVSVKSSDPKTMIETNRLLSTSTDYPLHIGVTESGIIEVGTIRSSLAIGALLLYGIGDTIRVSLTASPVEEVRVAKEILKSLGLREGVSVISCPTCKRCEIDVEGIARELLKRINGIKKPLKIAVMGCVVNGPGEAKDADFGITGGKNSGVIFRKGKVLKKVPKEHIIDELMEEVALYE